MPTASSLRLLPVPLVFAVFFLLAAGPVPGAGAAGNSGTLQVLDEAGEEGGPGNDPHVDCQDFWLAGSGMASGSGTLAVRTMAPTGDGDVVLTGSWTGTQTRKGFEFLAGPFTLPHGHYQAEAQAADGEAKAKTFWVDACPSSSSTAPPPSTSTSPPPSTSTPPPSATSTSSPSTSAPPPSETTSSSEPPSSTSTTSAPPSETSTSTTPSETSTSTAPPSETTTSTAAPGSSTSTAPPPESSTSTPPAPPSETATSSATASTTSSGPSSETPAPSAVPCPTELRAFARGDGSIRLTFEPPAPVDAIRIVRDGAPLATLPPGSASYVDAGTEVGDAYSYHVLAVLDGVPSADCPAMEVTAIPDLGAGWAMALASAGGLAALAFGSRRKP